MTTDAAEAEEDHLDRQAIRGGMPVASPVAELAVASGPNWKAARITGQDLQGDDQGAEQASRVRVEVQVRRHIHMDATRQDSLIPSLARSLNTAGCNGMSR